MGVEHTRDVQVVDRPEHDRFEVLVDGELAGFADYRRRPGRMVLPHTEVDGAYQGMGLAGRLARAALDAAREQQVQVVPLCSFIVGYIQKNPGYADLVVDEYRARLDT